MTKRAVHPAPVPRPKRPVIEHLPAISVVALTAMTVLPHLVPFDTAAAQWNNVAPLMLWMLLLAGWALAGVLRGKASVVLDRTTIAVLALTLLPGLSALVMLISGDGNVRLALNLAWQWASFGIAFFLARQWLQNAADVRMLAAVMLATCVALATLAPVQFLYLMPQSRLAYRANPERMLREAGLDPTEGSPQRKRFEDRLESTEPTATFALTNSLAGLLTPWLVLLAGLAASTLAARAPALTWRFLLIAALLAGVLVLTKSRTAVLATFVGICLVLIYATPLARRVDWRIPLALGLIGVVAVLGGVVTGTLDVEVLSEAPKSILYRVQYWQATAAMIRTYPLLGAGPGNFQDTYKHFQLPEASENIADPHNFVLEIWATAGTLGLLALVALAAVFPWELRRTGPSERIADVAPPTAPLGAHALGAGIGVLLGYGCGFLSDLMPDPVLLVTGVPAGALALWLLRPWILHGTLTVPMLMAPLVALLINLLAAGGISFPGVSTSVWLLMVMALVLADTGSKDAVQPRSLSRAAAIGWLAVAGVAGLLYHVSVYNPVFRRSAAVTDATLAIRTGRISEAIEFGNEAAAYDPVSPEPWVSPSAALVDLADIWHTRLLTEGDSPALREEFENACQQGIALDPRAEGTQTQVAHRWMTLYRRFGKRADLETARYHYQQAVVRYPNSARVHAQLAWALYVSGEPAAAAAEAEIALALDRRHEHSENKLRNLHIGDHEPAPGLEQTPPRAAMTAEPLMQWLRKASNQSGASP